MEDMGMTDKQFNGFLRMLIDRLKDIKNAETEEKAQEKLEKVLDDLQSTLED